MQEEQEESDEDSESEEYEEDSELEDDLFYGIDNDLSDDWTWP